MLLLLINVSAKSQENSADTSPRKITPKPLSADDIVAKVNGTNITREEYAAYQDENSKFVYDKDTSPKSTLNEMISRIVGIQKAKKNNLDKDPLVVARFNDMLFHAQVSADLEKKLQAITVSDDELKKYYEKNNEYHIQQILFRMRAVPSSKEVEETLTKAMDVYAVVKKNPDSFSEMASKLSQSTSYSTGGDMGFLPAARMGYQIHSKIQGKVIGSISEPIRSVYGFHIVKIINVKKFDEIDKNLYRKLVFDLKRDEVMNEYFANERKTAKIEILDPSLK